MTTLKLPGCADRILCPHAFTTRHNIYRRTYERAQRCLNVQWAFIAKGLSSQQRASNGAQKAQEYCADRVCGNCGVFATPVTTSELPFGPTRRCELLFFAGEYSTTHANSEHQPAWHFLWCSKRSFDVTNSATGGFNSNQRFLLF